MCMPKLQIGNPGYTTAAQAAKILAKLPGLAPRRHAKCFRFVAI
jgi:hypothetical protein